MQNFKIIDLFNIAKSSPTSPWPSNAILMIEKEVDVETQACNVNLKVISDINEFIEKAVDEYADINQFLWDQKTNVITVFSYNTGGDEGTSTDLQLVNASLDQIQEIAKQLKSKMEFEDTRDLDWLI